jgi:hypothetical protein
MMFSGAEGLEMSGRLPIVAKNLATLFLFANADCIMRKIRFNKQTAWKISEMIYWKQPTGCQTGKR